MSPDNMTKGEGPRYLRDRQAYFSDEQRERTKRESRKMERKVKESLRAQKNRARTMRYFEDIHAYGGVRVLELKEFREKGGKVVGTLCVMVPLELIRAAGAVPVRICSGYYEPVHPANELIGDAGLCPLVKATLGSKMVSSEPILDQVDLVVGPATCDGKMKLAEIYEDWAPVIMLNVPRVKTGDTTSKLWLEEVKYLKKRLEDLTGRRIKRKELLRQVERYNRANKAWMELMEYRKLPTPPISGRDSLLVAQASLLDDIDRWTKKVGELTTELSTMVKKGVHAGEEGAARVMLAGSPVYYPNFKIPGIIEESGGIVVTDEICTGHRVLSDPVVLEETGSSEVLRAVAERYFFPCTCACFSPNDDRIRRMEEYIRDFGVEGVVYHTLRGCHLNSLEATKIELRLRDMGIPMLNLESEYDEGDVEQVRTRAEAFVEMIKARRVRHLSNSQGGGS